jgi:hypothetical protein
MQTDQRYAPGIKGGRQQAQHLRIAMTAGTRSGR